MNCKSIREAIDTARRRSGYSETVRAHLNDCSDCRHHADETSSLVALLSAQPRVEAPADFEFRLRARIARAKSDPKPAVGTLEKFWSKSFSFAQAATAMVAMAVAITASTFYYTHHNEMASPNDAVALNVPPAVLPVDVHSQGVKTEVVSSEPVNPVVPMTKPTRPANRLQKNAGLQPISIQSVGSTSTVAKADNPDRFYLHSSKQVYTPPLHRGFIGAEGVELTKPRSENLSF